MKPYLIAIISVSVIGAGLPIASACVTSLQKPGKKSDWKKYFAAHMAQADRRTPASADGSLPDATHSPWGGTKNPWRPEAVLANAVSQAFNEAYRESAVADVLVSLPVKMLNSSQPPYGDGQTNSAVTFGNGWSETHPAFMATLIRYQNGSSQIKLAFHGKLQGLEKGVNIKYPDGDRWQTVALSGARVGASQLTEFTWRLSSGEGPQWGDLFQNHVAFVQGVGWKDWFPLDFRDVVKPAADLLAQLPESERKFGSGTLLDPERVSVQGQGGNVTPFSKMKDENFGRDVNGDRYFPVSGSGIHNEFPMPDGSVVRTAVGHGNTLVMEKSPAPFKLAYICFDARNLKEEEDFGVPSGGGWHEIGDKAETVFNTLEKSPVVFGYVNGQPANPPSGAFAYGLTDVAVIRKLQPGFALITAVGKTTATERANGTRAQTPTNEGRNYHWFIFDQAQDVCALEWVHRSVPSPTNHWGMDRE